jgi:hypothetical protein
MVRLLASPSSLWSHRTVQRQISLLVLHAVLLHHGAVAITCTECDNIPPTSEAFIATGYTCVTAVQPGSWYFDNRCSNAPAGTSWHTNQYCAESCSEAGVPYGGVTCCPPGTFTTRAGLVAAVDSWLDDEASAAAFYGSISSWDVSQVTDMQACRLERQQTDPAPPAPPRFLVLLPLQVFVCAHAHLSPQNFRAACECARAHTCTCARRVSRVVAQARPLLRSHSGNRMLRRERDHR